jgi:hypothetical protein
MITVDKDVLRIMREWGKNSNTNRSNKLHLISFYFIQGKSKDIEARIRSGHQIANIHGNLQNGMMNYYGYLMPLVNIIKMPEADNSVQNLIKSTKVTIYQMMERVNESDGKARCFCRQFEVTTMTNMYAFLNDVLDISYNEEKKEFHKPDESNVNDYKKLFHYDNTNLETQYIAIKTEYTIGNEESEKTSTTWHLLGDDDGSARTYYELSKEFGILPYPPDMGEIEKILL